MRTALRVVLGIFLFALTAHRLPAPISETPESPSPAGQSAKAKPKRTAKPKVTKEDSESSTEGKTSSPQSKSAALSNREPFNIPQSQMTASATSQHGGYEAGKAIDGNVNSMWHTPFNELWFNVPLVSLPQSIMLNLGGTYNVTALHYLPRQDGYLHGAISSYRVYLSTDGSNFTLIKAGSWASDPTEKTATFAPTRSSYIRLEAVAAYAEYASAAELNVTAITGTLSRQDSSANPSASQTTTPSPPKIAATAAPQAAGIPTAKPVPNKPGFVLSPFDPKTKAILDVRGIASGTKVKDKAGRIFIVP